jgi:uncharacterized protein YccT (UPF0319 family)
VNTAAGSVITPAVRVTVQDAFGNRVTSFTGGRPTITVAIGNNPGGATLSGDNSNLTGTAGNAGIATFNNLSLDKVGDGYTLTAAATGLTQGTSTPFAIGADVATKLVLTTQPSSSAQSGVALAQQPVVQLQDANSNPVSQAGVTVTAAIATGGGTLGGTLTATTTGTGAASFTNLSISGTGGDRTLSFTAPGLTSVTSTAITITAGAATQLTITTEPSSTAQSGVAFAQQPVIQVRDASGNPVSQAGVSVTAAIATGGGTLGGTLTAATNASGVASFTNLAITGTAGDRMLSFSATGVTGATSATISITAGAATELSITTQPSSSAQSGVAFAQQPVVQLRDASGNAVSQAGVTVTAAIATGVGTLGGTLTAATNAGGVASFTNLSIAGTAGDRTLSFSATGLTVTTSTTIAITAGAATELSITTQPSSSAQSGVAFAQQPVLQLRDASGNAVSQTGVTVTAAIATGAGALGGTLTATTNASGVASFTNLAITGTAGDRTLTFSAAGLTSATSGTITITASAATQLTITTQPSPTAQSGAPFVQQPVVQLRDASGNPVSQAGVTVTAAIATGAGTLGGTLTATTNGSGEASFTNLAITGAAGDRTLTFSATGLTGATSSTITITAGAASQLTITTQPSSAAQSGVAFAQQPVVQVRDASGNPVSQAGVTVTAAIATGAGTLGGTLTATTNGSGETSFTNLAITGTAGDRTLTFSATGLTSATSGTITITPGAATQLTITTQPSPTAQSGAPFAQQPVVQLRDANANAVSQAGVTVTAAIATGAGTLGGTLTATTNSSGVASFTNLAITGTAGDRTLTFSATGLTSATSGTITITAGAASQVTITTQPSATAQSGVAFAQQPVLQLRDASGNAVSQTGVTVTAAIATGAGTLGGTTTATTDGSGVASFTNLTISGTAGVRTLSFGASGLSGAASATITITAGAATQLVITTPPSSSAQSGAPLAQQPMLQLEDANGNPVSQNGVTVTATVAPAGATASNATATTGSNGAATFSGLTLTGTAGNYTLSFGATGLTSATSGTITLTAGQATSITNNSPTIQSAPAGTAVDFPPSVLLRDASGNAVAGVEVTFATGVNSGTVSPTTPIATGVDGIATVTSWTLSTIAGPNTLTATPFPGTITGSPVLFTATGTPGAPSSSQSSVTASPSPITASKGASASTITVTVRDAFGNAVSGVMVVLSATGTGNTLTPSGTTDGNGEMTGTLSSTDAGTKTITATVGSVTIAAQPSVTVNPAEASQLVFTAEPSDVLISSAITPAVVVTAQDAFGNTATGFTDNVLIAIGNDASGLLGPATLGGTLTVAAVSGVATFGDLTIDKTGIGYTLVVSAGGMSETSGGFTVLALP